VLGFIVGLAVGLGLLALSRQQSDQRLKRLLSRLEDRQPLPALGYDAQIASAIAEQQAQSEKLNKTVKDLQQVLKAAPIGYLQVDEENRLLWCNPQAQEFLDIAQGDYEPPRLLLALVRSYELDQLVERTRQTQQPCEARWTFNSISTDPSNYLERPAYPLQGYGLPISNGHVAVFLENRQEAVRLSQQRDRWISDVAHELKTPLTSIRLVAETLQMRVDSTLLSWVERLLKEVIRLSKLVDDVLNMSRLEQARSHPVEGTAVDLVPLIQAVWQSLEPLAKLKGLTFAYRGPSALIATVNDALIHRLLFNLLSNAVKYSPADQVIQVKLSVGKRASGSAATTAATTAANSVANPAVNPAETETRAVSAPLAPNQDAAWQRHTPADSSILLEVIDRGSGFPAQDLPHVFDRFYRADPARSHAVALDGKAAEVSEQENALEMAELASSGTGLGLAIVRQIVTSHGGRVSAQNYPETGGAWLKVWLPGDRLVTVDQKTS
jgi:two-component system, OmpR family, phosphate regulon sensor histidine kinase PhoR